MITSSCKAVLPSHHCYLPAWQAKVCGSADRYVANIEAKEEKRGSKQVWCSTATA